MRVPDLSDQSHNMKLDAFLQGTHVEDAGAIAREFPADVPGAIRRARLAAIASLQAPTGH